MQVERLEVAGGDAGVKQTIAEMNRLIAAGATDLSVRQAASSLVRDLPPRSYDAQATVIRNWAARSLKFLRDPKDTELLHTPALMLQMIRRDGVAQVDCDDAAILTAALGRSIGLRSRIVVVAFDEPTAPYSHTWAELATPIGEPRWIEQDVTRQAQQIDPSRVSRTLIVETTAAAAAGSTRGVTLLLVFAAIGLWFLRHRQITRD